METAEDTAHITVNFIFIGFDIIYRQKVSVLIKFHTSSYIFKLSSICKYYACACEGATYNLSSESRRFFRQPSLNSVNIGSLNPVFGNYIIMPRGSSIHDLKNGLLVCYI